MIETKVVNSRALAKVNFSWRVGVPYPTAEELLKQAGVAGQATASEMDHPAGEAASLSAGIPRRSRKVTSLVLLVALCVPGVVWNLGMAVSCAAGGGIDFNEFYSASRLAGTGHLYDWEALRRLEKDYGPPIPCGRLPVVSFAMKPLTLAGYLPARFLWLAISVAALVGFGLMWPGVNRRLMVAALAWSVAAGYLLVLGQDTPVWLVSFAAGLLLLERGKPRLAGVAFALCLSKYHLGLAIPVFLVAQKRWQTLVAGGVTAAALLAACFPIEGLAWPLRYWQVLSKPIFSVADGRMPNLRGIAYWLPASAAIEAVCAATLIILLWRVCRGTGEIGMAGAAAAACGLLLGHHGYANDCVLLMPLAVLILQKPGPLWLRGWSALLLTPVVAGLLTSSKPVWGQALAVGFVFAALMVEARRVSRPQTGTVTSRADLAA